MWHVRAAAHPGSGQIASMPRDGDVTNVALHGLVLTVTGRVPPPLRRCGGRVRPQVDPPPGLGAKTKQVHNAIESTLKKAWGTMPPEAQAALKSMGIDFTPEPECPP